MAAFKLKQYLGFFTLPCSEIARLASDSLDRKLPRRQQAVLRLHLLVCMCCFRYWKHLHFLRTVLRSPSLYDTDHSQSAPALSPEARDRIRHTLTSHLD